MTVLHAVSDIGRYSLLSVRLGSLRGHVTDVAAGAHADVDDAGHDVAGAEAGAGAAAGPDGGGGHRAAAPLPCHHARSALLLPDERCRRRPPPG